MLNIPIQLKNKLEGNVLEKDLPSLGVYLKVSDEHFWTELTGQNI